MSEKRVLRKMKKLASRINGQMETVRDIMEDLEIEFELLQTQISKLEAKKAVRGQEEELEVIVEDKDEDEEIIDIENTSSVTINQKF